MRIAAVMFAIALGAGAAGGAAWAKTPNQNASGVIGSGGSAATGGTAASTIGVGGESTGGGGTSAVLGTGGTAAATHGRTNTHSGVHGGGGNLNGQAHAMANNGGGVWSKSHTHTRVSHNGQLSSRTKSMSHEPGGPPTKSSSRMSERM
jgi:hypothetical protein